MTRFDLLLQQGPSPFLGGSSMRILIAGAGGLIGRRLVGRFSAAGHHVVRLVRPPRGPQRDELLWEPDADRIDPDAMRDVDAVVNLAGENIAQSRWTEDVKRRIASSRLRATDLLVRAIGAARPGPRVFLSASAIGFYGSRGDELLTEESPPGDGFLADLCRQWETAALKAATHGCRVVCLRIGMVLDTAGGALAKMLPVFRWGLGGVLGDGKQYVSWITNDDVAAAIEWILNDDRMVGPVNLTAPHPVTNREFTSALAAALRRPAVFRVPRFALLFALGEMAEALLLRGARAAPQRLTEAGFRFGDEEVGAALRRLLRGR